MRDACSEMFAVYDLSDELLLHPVWDDYRCLFTASTNEPQISGIMGHSGSKQMNQSFPIIVNWPFFMPLMVALWRSRSWGVEYYVTARFQMFGPQFFNIYDRTCFNVSVCYKRDILMPLCVCSRRAVVTLTPPATLAHENQCPLPLVPLTPRTLFLGVYI